MADNDDDKCPDAGKDMIHLAQDLGNGYTSYVRHHEDCGLQVGIGRMVDKGQGDLSLKHQGPGHTYSVKEAPPSTGPSTAATPEYRHGWDRIFGTQPTVGQA